MDELHVVFGAGQVGGILAGRLLDLGKRVRIVSRTGPGAPGGAERVLGDAMDPGFCRDQGRGAVAIYHCLNAPYRARAWAECLPTLAANLVEAAGRVGARLVVLDNLYALGRPRGRLLDEDVSMNPCSRKGEIRARIGETLFAAHQRGDARVTMGRASDFYGPGGLQTHFGERFWKPALSGRTVPLWMELDTPHSYHYLRDVARGLAILGMSEEDVCGRAWMLPCAPAGSTRELVARLAHEVGRPIRVRSMPPVAARILGWGAPLLREVAEMSYQWEEPFVVDDRRFRSRFGLEATPVAEAARETVEWAVETYRSGGPAGSAGRAPG